MLGRLLAAHLLLAATQVFAGQAAESTPTPPAKSVLEGTAVDFTTAEPLRKATIRVVPSSGPAPGYMGITDPSGHFQLEGIPEGDYELTGERAGYLKSEFGARRPGGTGTTLHLKAGDKLTDLTVKLVRCSVITGKVFGENGEPVRALVYAVSQNWLRGQRLDDQSEGIWTNDQGEYRIVDLPPGRYYLCAEGSFESFVDKQGGPEKRILPTCYPDSRTPDGAIQLEVQAGQNLPGLNMRLTIGPVFHIRGKLAGGPLHDPDQRVALAAHLHNFGNGIFDLESEGKGDGSFDFSGAPAGSYDIELIGEEYKQIIARRSVEVKASDVNGLIISVPSRLELKGVVRFLNTNFSWLKVTARDVDSPAMSQPYSAEIEPNGTFKIENVWPGRYVFGLHSGNQGDYLKSVQYRGSEVLGATVALTSTAQVEIVVNGGAGRVDGLVQPSDSDANVSGLQAVLASESPRLDDEGLLLAKTDQNGHFSFQKVAPGKYYAFATADVDPGLLENREFLAQLQQSGIEVELPANDTLQIHIPVVSPDAVQSALSVLGL